jgi:fermentation-respiration switch protein FrsA (DUF1100 family)
MDAGLCAKGENMEKIKIFIIIFTIILTLLIALYFIVGNFFYNIALNPKTSKTFVLGEDEEEIEEQEEKGLEKIDWLSQNSEDVYITSSNNGNLKLHAYEIMNAEQSDIWTIVIHGYSGQGKDMTYYVQQFYNRGYNVLVVDLRGHGQSEGDYIGMGWHDRLDIIDWANYLIGKDNNCKIILHGVSMGGATVMMTTGEKLPDNIKVAIEDCGYTSIWDEFEMQLKGLYNLPAFPVLNAASSVCKIKAGYKVEEGSSVEQVKKSKTPTLFIHGELDSFVPFEMLDKVYESANCKKEKLVIEGAAHAEASSINPELYWKTIDRFIKENI